MEYPQELYPNERQTLNEDKILDIHKLYQRHKPGYDWKESEGLPDFTKIKIDPKDNKNNQSYNWELFSAPAWVRFNEQKEYKKEYAVVSYLAGTIRNIERYDNSNLLEPGLLGVEHTPNDINYSHCQLYCTDKFVNSEELRKKRRAARLAIKHGAKTLLKPFEEQ